METSTTVTLLHADGSMCRHEGKPVATMADDGGPLCPAGQPVTHVLFNGRRLTIGDAMSAFASMAATITQAMAPHAAAYAELGRKLDAGPHIRILAAAGEAIERERAREENDVR
jgi:hypothetical protein